MIKNTQPIYITTDGQVQLAVKVENETVWLDQKQMAELFDIDRSVVTKHINNIIKTQEVDEKSNVQKMHIANSDKPIKIYSLDLILSVGYRVNSRQATQFRIWANKILKDYLLKGYAINETRLEEQVKNFQELQQAIEFIAGKSKTELLTGKSSDLIDLLNEFSQSFTLLEQYDQGKIILKNQKKPEFTFEYDQVLKLITDFRAKLTVKGEAGSLMGQEVDHKFESIIKTISQTFDGQDLYPSVEEKAAHILYLTIKDHPFADGNKRIAAMLFVYFLARNNFLMKVSGEKKISDNTLVAIALLVAISDPRDKDVMIKIITNLLK
jgi:death-on-curing family protein